ncbi:MAG: V-type ATPase 116kDa subunit family protein [Chromatiales bacterium]|jgi:V/A-type H+-transporting ATPase subunit I
MLLRSDQAQWFETYIARQQTVVALEALAASGEVELESDPAIAVPLDLSLLHDAITAFRDLERRCHHLLEDVKPSAAAPMIPPEQLAKVSLNYLNRWCESTERLLSRQLRLETQRQDLILLDECLNALAGESAGFPHFAHQSKFLYKGVFACPLSQRLESEICIAVDEYFPGAEHNFFFVADLPEKQLVIERAYQSATCILVQVPAWLPVDPGEQKQQILAKREKIESQIRKLAQRLQAQQQESELADALANMRLLSWYADKAQGLTTQQTFCHVTGWTKLTQPQELERLLEHKGIHSQVRFISAPEDYLPPINLILPGWAQPFHLFVEMLGTPSRDEVNPILLIPFIIALLFGYMFPDIGHGLILLIVSSLLYRRWPEGRFLIACGLSSVLFGFVFGDFFGIEGLLQPIWIKPLDEPLLILIPPLILGVILMLLGLVFNGIEAYWRQVFKSWLLRGAAVLTMYASGCMAIFYPQALWLTVLSFVWFVSGALIIEHKDRIGRLISSLAHLIQSLFELFLNTFSFLRVGAFALAHAALSSSVVQLADGIENHTTRIAFLIIGHLLIVTIEGLVAFVQTTRLVLFEFFTRFLKADGRIFRPLSTPDEATKERG